MRHGPDDGIGATDVRTGNLARAGAQTTLDPTSANGSSACCAPAASGPPAPNVPQRAIANRADSRHSQDGAKASADAGCVARSDSAERAAALSTCHYCGAVYAPGVRRAIDPTVDDCGNCFVSDEDLVRVGRDRAAVPARLPRLDHVGTCVVARLQVPEAIAVEQGLCSCSLAAAPARPLALDLPARVAIEDEYVGADGSRS